MRIVDQKHSFNYEGFRVIHATGVVSPFVSTNREITLKRTERSDVTINPRVDGWRQPSAYECYVTTNPIVNVSHVLHRIEHDGRHSQTSEYHGPIRANGAVPLPGFTRQELVNQLPVSSSYRSEAEVRALNAVAARKGKVLESLAEMRSTMKSLASNATTLYRFALQARSGNFYGAARTLGLNPRSRKARRARDRTIAAGGGLGNAWLNYSFGISPIIDDMVLSLIIFKEDREIRLKGVGRARLGPAKFAEHWTSSSGVAQLQGQSGWDVDYTIAQERRATCNLWYGVRCSQLARYNELGAYSVPATAWALVPGSFVVDWVLPVQDVLQAMTATVGLTFKGGSYTVMSSRRLGHCKVTPRPEFQRWQTHSFDYVAPKNVRSMAMRRTAYKQPPIPKPLYIKDPLNAWTAVTSLALLAGIVKSSSKGL